MHRAGIKYKIGIVIIGCLFSIQSLAQDLSQHKWEDRILLVFTNDLESKIFKNQMLELGKDEGGMKERKLAVYEVVEDRYRCTSYQRSNEVGIWKETDESMFQRFTIKQPFSVVLIGLDGGVKLKKDEIVTQEELFRIIDSMPMRRFGID